MLKDARKKGRLFVNPMEAVRRFDVPKRELHYLGAVQVKDLCERLGRVSGVLFLVMAFCGLRIGEVLGLQWPDLDLTRRRLFVQRQALWRRNRDCQAGQPRGHLAEQNGGPNPLGLVFPSEDGTPLYSGNVRRRVFTPALATLGLTGIRCHDFRRTFIAMHVEAGTHPKLVQERVGYSNIKLTMDVYGKLVGKMALGEEQAAPFDSMASETSLTLVNVSQQDTPKQAKTTKVSPKYERP